MKSDKKIWFKPKCYGWGFFPVSREGGLMTLVLLALVFLSAWLNGLFIETGPTAMQLGRFFLDLLFIVFSTSWFAEKHMEEPLQWRRGRD